MEIKTVPVVYSVVYDGIMDEFASLNVRYRSLEENPDQEDQWLMCSLLASSTALLAGRILYFVDYNATTRGLNRIAILSQEQIDLLQHINIIHKKAIDHPALYANYSQHDMSVLYHDMAVNLIDLFRIALVVRESVDRIGGPFPEECGTKSRIFFNRLLCKLARKPISMPKWRTDMYFIAIDSPGCTPDMQYVEKFAAQ